MILSLLSTILIQYVPFQSVDDFTSDYQGEAVCVDTLESKHGSNALIVDGTNLYTISNVCDFE
jgi:hypothetical protein